MRYTSADGTFLSSGSGVAKVSSSASSVLDKYCPMCGAIWVTDKGMGGGNIDIPTCQCQYGVSDSSPVCKADLNVRPVITSMARKYMKCPLPPEPKMRSSGFAGMNRFEVFSLAELEVMMMNIHEHELKYARGPHSECASRQVEIVESLRSDIQKAWADKNNWAKPSNPDYLCPDCNNPGVYCGHSSSCNHTGSPNSPSRYCNHCKDDFHIEIESD